MGQKVVIKFWWESELSSASRNHLTNFCRPFVHYACLRLFSAIVHFIRNNQGRGQGGVGVNPPLSLIFYKNSVTRAKGINYFLCPLNANTTE